VQCGGYNYGIFNASPEFQLQKKTAVAQVRAEKAVLDKANKLVAKDTEKRRREALSKEDRKAEDKGIAEGKGLKKARKDNEYNASVSAARSLILPQEAVIDNQQEDADDEDDDC
jgi:hypothetical protein